MDRLSKTRSLRCGALLFLQEFFEWVFACSWATPNIFLSYMAPDSDAEMSLTAPRIPQRLPVLWLIGKKDLLVSQGSAYVYDKLPLNPKSKYMEVDGGHFDAGGRNANLIVSWIQEALKP